MFKSYRLGLVVLGILSLSACDKLNNVREQITASLGNSKKSASVPAQAVQPATAAAPSQAKATPANALLRVNDWSLSKEEFNDKLAALKTAVPEFDTKNKDQKKMILDRLAEQRLFVQEAEKQGLDKDKDVRMAIEEFRNTILVQQLAAKATETIDVTEQEEQDFYNKNAALFVKDGEWKVREIVVADETTARQIAADLAKGADFAQTAQQKSKGKTAAQGGDLGSLKQFTFPQMASAVLALNVGSVSSPVQGPEGFYIFKLEDKKGGEPLSFNEVKADLKNELLYQKKEQAVAAYLESLRKSADIQINEKLLEE